MSRSRSRSRRRSRSSSRSRGRRAAPGAEAAARAGSPEGAETAEAATEEQQQQLCEFHLHFNEEKLFRVWVCPKEFKSFLCSLGFCFGIEVVKNCEWACEICTVLIRGASHPYNCKTKPTSPLRVFDNFNSKAKTLATFNFSKVKSD